MMTANEFKKLIDNGRDIMFDCMNKHYTILTWTDDGIFIGEQITDTQKNDIHECYDTAFDLIEKFKVNNIPLKDIIDEIKITQYS